MMKMTRVTFVLLLFGVCFSKFLFLSALCAFV